MATQVKAQTTLSSGRVLRLVQQNPPGAPYFLEYLDGTDALSVPRWTPAVTFSPQDVIDILKGVGFIL